MGAIIFRGGMEDGSDFTPPALVKLNVGGRRFLSRYATLTRNGSEDNFFMPLLSGRFPVERDEKGYIFIDRNPAYFEALLDYLRSGEFHCPPGLSPKRLMNEANFYGIQFDGAAVNDVIDQAGTAPLSDFSLKQLLMGYKTASLERNYKDNQEGLQLVEKWVFEGFRAEAAKGKQIVVRFWPSCDTIINRCKQKWGDIVIQPLPPFMVNEPAHVFDNALYEVCKKGKEGLCWHLSKRNLTVEATDNSDYLTTHTHVDRNNAVSINTYAWCVVATNITPHVYHAAEAVSIVWTPDDPEAIRLLQNPPSVKKAAAKPFNPH